MGSYGEFEVREDNKEGKLMLIFILSVNSFIFVDIFSSVPSAISSV